MHKRGKQKNKQRRFSGRRIRFLINRHVADAADTVRGFFIGNVGPRTAYAPRGNIIPRKTRVDPGAHAVLLIQGFVHTRSVLNVLEARLRRDGFPVFSFNMAGFLNVYNTRPIEVIAERMAIKVERLMRRKGLKSLSIIAHSMGGLVSRYYVQALGGHRHITQLITLGTPHHGTPVAWVVALPPVSLITICGRQMVPGSQFIRDLGAMTLPSSVRLVSIYSRSDVICPYRCSVLEPKAGERMRNLCVNGIGHTSLLISDRVYRLIRAELEGDQGDALPLAC